MSTRQSSVVRWRIALVSNFIVTVLCGRSSEMWCCNFLDRLLEQHSVC